MPSFRAGFRSSSRRRLRVESVLETEGKVAVRSESAGLPPARCFQFGRLPNKSLEPTPVTKARVVWLSSGAAQLNRWAIKGSGSEECDEDRH